MVILYSKFTLERTNPNCLLFHSSPKVTCRVFGDKASIYFSSLSQESGALKALMICTNCCWSAIPCSTKTQTG